MFNAVVGTEPVFPVLTTYSWFGVWSVSENSEIAPVFEVARALPVIDPKEVKALEEPPKFPGVTIWAPKSLPMMILSPARSNSRELGETGEGFSLPTEALDDER